MVVSTPPAPETSAVSPSVAALPAGVPATSPSRGIHIHGGRLDAEVVGLEPRKFEQVGDERVEALFRLGDSVRTPACRTSCARPSARCLRIVRGPR